MADMPPPGDPFYDSLRWGFHVEPAPPDSGVQRAMTTELTVTHHRRPHRGRVVQIVPDSGEHAAPGTAPPQADEHGHDHEQDD